MNFTPEHQQFFSWFDDTANTKGGLHALAFVAKGSKVECLTDEAEWNALLTADVLTGKSKAVIIHRVYGDKPDESPNTVDSPFSCDPDQVVSDYSATLNFTMKFHPDNLDFLNEIRKYGVGQFCYVTTDYLIAEPPAAPLVTLFDAFEQDGFHVMRGVASWSSIDAPKYLPALKSLFKCP